MTQLLLRLLGPFQAKLDDVSITTFESDKARALLSYLAIESAIPHPRTQLAGLLWPDWSESQARANLRHTLATLRTTIRDRKAVPPFLRINHQTIQLNPAGDLWLDVAEFEQLTEIPNLENLGAVNSARIGELEQAVSLYRGPFIDGFNLSGCAEFESWLLLTRTRLEGKVLATLQTLSECFLAQKEYQKAYDYAQRQVDVDPLQEDAYYQGINALALMGERTRALSLYKQMRQRLAEELNVEPSPKLVKLHEQIQSGKLQGVILPSSQQATLTSSEQLSPAEHYSQEPPHNLPAPTSSFIGRNNEQQTITKLLLRQDVRLVTLHGPGGVGKTRLAQEVAQQLIPEFADGLFWIDLVPLRSTEDLLNELAHTLDVQETVSRDLRATLIHYLQNRQLLLVFDNFEHLLPAASIIGDLLSYVPKLKVLTTSREVLHLYGEFEFPIEPFALGELTDTNSLSTIVQNAAIELFTQRGQAIKPNFQLNESNASTVAQICKRMDGLPLALELAASQLKYFAPAQLLRQLQTPPQNEHVVLRATVNRPNRHQTMLDAIAWSYRLLSQDARLLFRHCAVFTGGFTPSALAAVAPSHLQEHTQTILFSLVDKNLVRCMDSFYLPMNSDDLEPRFTLFETIREFALVKLIEHHELANAESIFADYYLQLVESIDSNARKPMTADENDQLSIEYDNLRAVMHRVLEVKAFSIGFRLAKALWRFWVQRAYLNKVHTWLIELLDQAHTEPPSPEYTATLFAAGVSCRNSRDDYHCSRMYFEQCLKMSRDLNDKVRIGLALAFLAIEAFDSGNYEEARRYGQESLQLRRELDVDWEIAMILANLGYRETKCGNFDAARAYLGEALVYQYKVNEPYGIALTCMCLCILARHEGNFAQAESYLAESQKICQQTTLPGVSVYVNGEQGRLQLAIGNYAAASGSMTEALAELDTVNNRGAIPVQFCTLVDLFALQGMAADALMIAAFLEKFLNKLRMVLPPVDKEEFDRSVRIAHEALTPEAAATAWAKGEGMTLEKVIAAAVYK